MSQATSFPATFEVKIASTLAFPDISATIFSKLSLATPNLRTYFEFRFYYPILVLSLLDEEEVGHLSLPFLVEYNFHALSLFNFIRYEAFGKHALKYSRGSTMLFIKAMAYDTFWMKAGAVNHAMVLMLDPINIFLFGPYTKYRN